MTVDEFRYIQIAKEIMSWAHYGQTRSKNGAAFETHPVRVSAMAAELGYPIFVIIAMLWHDILEDGPELVRQNSNALIGLAIEKGIMGTVAIDAVRIVDHLTKYSGESRSDYFDKIAKSRDEYIIIGKVLDRIDNLREGIETQSNKWLSKYLIGCQSVIDIAMVDYSDHPSVLFLEYKMKEVSDAIDATSEKSS